MRANYTAFLPFCSLPSPLLKIFYLFCYIIIYNILFFVNFFY